MLLDRGDSAWHLQSPSSQGATEHYRGDDEDRRRE